MIVPPRPSRPGCGSSPPSRGAAAGRAGPPPAASRASGSCPQPAGLDLKRFEKVGRDQYRSPGGVVIRVVLREGGGWDVADVDYDGEARLEQLADGRVRIKIGDLRFEYSGDFERRIRLS